VTLDACKQPKRKVLIGAIECMARYDYERGFQGNRDEPPYDPSISITEVLINGEWIDELDCFTSEALTKAEERLIEAISDEEAAALQDYWDAIAEDGRMGEWE